MPAGRYVSASDWTKLFLQPLLADGEQIRDTFSYFVRAMKRDSLPLHGPYIKRIFEYSFHSPLIEEISAFGKIPISVQAAGNSGLIQPLQGIHLENGFYDFIFFLYDDKGPAAADSCVAQAGRGLIAV